MMLIEGDDPPTVGGTIPWAGDSGLHKSREKLSTITHAFNSYFATGCVCVWWLQIPFALFPCCGGQWPGDVSKFLFFFFPFFFFITARGKKPKICGLCNYLPLISPFICPQFRQHLASDTHPPSPPSTTHPPLQSTRYLYYLLLIYWIYFARRKVWDIFLPVFTNIWVGGLKENSLQREVRLCWNRCGLVAGSAPLWKWVLRSHMLKASPVS